MVYSFLFCLVRSNQADSLYRRHIGGKCLASDTLDNMACYGDIYKIVLSIIIPVGLGYLPV